MLGGGSRQAAGRLLTAGRYAVRAVFSAGAVDFATTSQEATKGPFKKTIQEQATADVGEKQRPKKGLSIYSSQCGFAKNMRGGASQVLVKDVYGEDACFSIMANGTYVVGVADGVGGWSLRGVDPSLYSTRLMRECKKIAHSGDFDPTKPVTILEKAYKTMDNERPRVDGSSTACLLTLHEDRLYSANLGDSGFIVVRGGELFYQSKEQLHYFNAPYQLSSAPDGGGFLKDLPTRADEYDTELMPGDIILLATDGLWDNVPLATIIKELEVLKSAEKLDSACNAIALTARKLATDTRPSPFALKALVHGLSFEGGKPDDITVICLLIV
ncbi:unnamed protein product, partial [Mesorhabditis spiculigera]